MSKGGGGVFARFYGTCRSMGYRVYLHIGILHVFDIDSRYSICSRAFKRRDVHSAHMVFIAIDGKHDCLNSIHMSIPR